MNTAAKLLSAMRNNPRDWRIEHLLTVAGQFGITVRGAGGSHCVFSHEAVPEVVVVPAHRPIKPVYVRQFVAQVDKVKESPA
jgi:predicted RNA binding protein YcfA (HicA-like mRNA interferase family)